MKKKIAIKSEICGRLRFDAVERIRRLQFLLLEYRLLMDSDEGSALPLSRPWFLLPLSLVYYVIATRALALIRLPCYFVKLGSETVGLFAVEESYVSLLVASLAVAKHYGRLGIGTCILAHAEKTARRRGKTWLQVDVFRNNAPAQLFYTRYGFRSIRSGRALCMMRKDIIEDS